MNYTELLKLATLFETEVIKTAKKWRTMPEGWKAKSRKSFFKNLGDNTVTECIERIEGHIDDPGAFCASLKDRVKKTTKWRKGNPENLKKKKKKASHDAVDEAIQSYMLNMFSLNGGRLYGMTPGATPDYRLTISSEDDLYTIKIVASLNGKNGYDAATIFARPKAYIPEYMNKNANETKQIYRRELLNSLENMLNDQFDADFAINVLVV